MISLEQLVLTCLMTPLGNPQELHCIWGLPLNIVGLSGCGKSQRIGQVCSAVKLSMFTVYPSAKQPEDFGGAPYVTPEGIKVGCILPAANRLLDLGEGVLLIDELTTASPRVQGAALGVVQERRIGDQLLPPKTRIITAMNPPELAAGGYPLEAPLANRFLHYNYTPPSVGEWSNWAMGMEATQLPIAANACQIVQQNWGNHWSGINALVLGFINANRDKLHKQPAPGTTESSSAWPSHRTWDYARRVLCTARCLNMPKELDSVLVSGCVGEGVMVEWEEWVKKADLPHPKQALDVGWKPDNQRMDITYAVAISIALWVGELGSVPEEKGYYGAKAWNLVETIHDVGQPDIAVVLAHKLLSIGLGHASKDARVAAAAKPAILKLGKSGVATFGSVLC